MAFKNFYLILGIKNVASLDEIKAAYRELAKKFHPDKNPGNVEAEERFKEIQEAYAILSNADKRRKYDLNFASNSYTANYNQRRSNAAYTGNAYQYAQQQAQYSRARSTQANSSKPVEQDKNEFKERYQILVSVGVAMLLLYFIISYANGRKTENAEIERTLNKGVKIQK